MLRKALNDEIKKNLNGNEMVITLDINKCWFHCSLACQTSDDSSSEICK
jgi:hypothetical protein